jgi:hypothetical protein
LKDDESTIDEESTIDGEESTDFDDAFINDCCQSVCVKKLSASEVQVPNERTSVRSYGKTSINFF